MQGEAVNSVTTYEPYGTLLMRTGSSGTVYGYTGEQMDGGNGAYLSAGHDITTPALRIFTAKDFILDRHDIVYRNIHIFTLIIIQLI